MDKQLTAFLEYLKKERGYSDNTIAAYHNDLSQFHKYLHKHYPTLTHPNQVSADIVDSYVADMKHKPYASSSVARKVAAIKSYFHHLHYNQNIEEDPTQAVDSPKVEKRLPTTLSIDDVDLLLAAPTIIGDSPKHIRDTALLILLYATGMRVTEVVSLQLDDLNLEKLELRSPSKNNEPRILPFDKETQTSLRRYLEEGRPQLVRNPEQTALFLNHRGQQLTRQGLWLIIKAYAKEADLSSAVTPHTLRHSFASHKLTSGSDLQEVQQLLGHANISTTQIYTQINKSNNDENE